MTKCQCCKAEEALWSWQPFGPNEAAQSAFMLCGSHYRGFPVIKVGDHCKSKIEQLREVHFSYRGNLYTYFNGIVANNTSRSGTDLPVRKADLIGHSLERDASLIRLEGDGSLYLVHVQAWLDDGRCILFNGEVPIPLKDFEWIER